MLASKLERIRARLEKHESKLEALEKKIEEEEAKPGNYKQQVIQMFENFESWEKDGKTISAIAETLYGADNMLTKARARGVIRSARKELEGQDRWLGSSRRGEERRYGIVTETDSATQVHQVIITLLKALSRVYTSQMHIFGGLLPEGTRRQALKECMNITYRLTVGEEPVREEPSEAEDK